MGRGRCDIGLLRRHAIRWVVTRALFHDRERDFDSSTSSGWGGIRNLSLIVDPLLIQFGEKLFDAKFTKDLFVLVLPPFMSEGGKSLWKTIHPNQLGNILGVPAYSVIPSASGGCPEPKGIETARDHVDLHYDQGLKRRNISNATCKGNR